MSRRVASQHPGPILILVDGAEVIALPGEMLASALLAADKPVFRNDLEGKARGMFCNMGTCGECFVTVEVPGRPARRLRACLIPVEPGMKVQRG
ncbi:2Fe-2S iron-sulfur cluster protein [Blastomonas natatoria]|uniref:2Fe-2S iron-sulfur cluster protein n=1 Tax=Blastomonas natatoria TaxID=34015 RepID=A0A2V3UYN9_9SPHN|nr:(2Fe-2S)-binding protein [Blastomonas natatoria]PXW74440.1 2Fe-2S iron-sulfur cluster protein [Blastomonas natatoria]